MASGSYADTDARLAGQPGDEPPRRGPSTSGEWTQARPAPAPPRQGAAAARPLDETAEITDEAFWAYIRNEVGR